MTGLRRIAFIGNPNTGKTTLFNRLCGVRHRTSNFPGTTQEARTGSVRGAEGLELIDLPGVYSLDLNQTESEICRRVLDGTLAVDGNEPATPSGVLVVADATNLPRNLLIVGEVLRRRLPTVVMLNMIDLARKRGLHIDLERLSRHVGCSVIACSARTGEGVEAAAARFAAAGVPNVTPPGSREGLEAWAEAIYADVASTSGEAHAFASGRHFALTDALDRVFTHPVGGLSVFVLVMLALFWTVFRLATVPMDLIDSVFASLSAWVRAAMPDGLLREFLAGGVVNGVGATAIFLPQICLLFLLISLLEDTGYLARAAFVTNRLLAPFGLSGHAFVPLLSSHACALPGIMACRAIPDRRERLAAILSAPFMSCSARIPVYVLLTQILFPGRPAMQALAFAGCYVLGVAAGLLSALIARRTILRGAGRAMALELPSYKLPSLVTASLATWDRAWVFLRSAGTNILAISIVLWWLSAFPHAEPPREATVLRTFAAHAAAPGNTPWPGDLTREERARFDAEAGSDERARAWEDEADAIEARHALQHSFAGSIGRFVQPVFAPLGFDWKLTVGVVSSFAAREVFVSTMAVMVTGHDDADDEGVRLAVSRALRDDGSPIFDTRTAWALLVYYVLAMQCLPTLAVTAKEAGGWKWAALQLGWMCGVAYLAGMLVRGVLSWAGVS